MSARGEGQAGHARLLGHVFAGPRRRVRAWSDPAQPAVLNHILPTRPEGVMPIYELVCWLRPSVTPGPGWRGNGSRRRATRRRRGGEVCGPRRSWRRCALAARRSAYASLKSPPAWFFDAASTAAHRNSRDPCLEIDPRRTLVSDSRCFGVSPAHEHNRSADAKRVTSPTSATITAPSTGPTPSIAWIARYPRWLRICVAIALSSRATSLS